MKIRFFLGLFFTLYYGAVAASAGGFHLLPSSNTNSSVIQDSITSIDQPLIKKNSVALKFIDMKLMISKHLQYIMAAVVIISFSYAVVRCLRAFKLKRYLRRLGSDTENDQACGGEGKPAQTREGGIQSNASNAKNADKNSSDPEEEEEKEKEELQEEGWISGTELNYVSSASDISSDNLSEDEVLTDEGIQRIRQAKKKLKNEAKIKLRAALIQLGSIDIGEAAERQDKGRIFKKPGEKEEIQAGTKQGWDRKKHGGKRGGNNGWSDDDASARNDRQRSQGKQQKALARAENKDKKETEKKKKEKKKKDKDENKEDAGALASEDSDSPDSHSPFGAGSEGQTNKERRERERKEAEEEAREKSQVKLTAKEKRMLKKQRQAEERKKEQQNDDQA